jgi:2-polyprenyl-3-methyl-5-hydroxy-6-metoxy-1,4-benzoquinol methylase
MTSFDFEMIWENVSGYMQHYSPTHRHIFSQLLSEIQRGEIATVADIGCGEGSNLLFLRNKFPDAKLSGFDISQTALEHARASVQATYCLLDIQKEAPERTYDLVFCADVVEHLEDGRGTFAHIFQENKHFVLFSTVQGQMREFEKTIGHVHSYRSGELKNKLEAAGFNALKIVKWGFLFYSPIYQNLSDKPSVESVSHGQYGFSKKLACNVLYSSFLFNRMRKGDIIFVLETKN